jgi:hypothetical protein
MLPGGLGDGPGTGEVRAAGTPARHQKGSVMTRESFVRGRSLRVAAVLAFAALPVLVSSGLAQEATPADAMQAADGPHPAHIHSGSCAELGDVVVPLNDVAAREGEERGMGAGHAVKGSHTVVEMPFDEILDGGHAINVHLSAEEIDTYIACGDIMGVVFPDEDDGEQQLVIGLAELNDSGHVGIAYLTEDEDGTTEVAVNLIEPDEMQ